jgi:hypothetical protein
MHQGLFTYYKIENKILYAAEYRVQVYKL